MATLGLCSSLLMLLLLALNVLWVQGGYEHTCTLATRRQGSHRAGICGSRLPKVIQQVCRVMGRGYAGATVEGRKRSARLQKLSRTTRDASFDENLRDVLLNKREALSYLKKRSTRLSTRGRLGRFGTQGITCECCYNQCSLSELLQYCN
uniref:Insulin-like 2B n=1 Tax=Charonia tritonis TaxID=1960912 RepID=A0A1S6JQ33_9CAEN|nr:insulin-like 2B precursor [Charonia tritonis]